jgi:hypothetical protein
VIFVLEVAVDEVPAACQAMIWVAAVLERRKMTQIA